MNSLLEKMHKYERSSGAFCRFCGERMAEFSLSKDDRHFFCKNKYCSKKDSKNLTT